MCGEKSFGASLRGKGVQVNQRSMCVVSVPVEDRTVLRVQEQQSIREEV